MTSFAFSVEVADGAARAGRVATAHGTFETPAFMAVGTAATVKAMMPASVAETGTQVVLGNTYHLMLRPTAERVAALGGLHRFMHWNGPILTDSGGFQVMSLAKLRKLDEEGVRFQSHIDGSRHLLTPERSIEIQRLLGSDIAMCLDECVAYPATEAEAARAMHLSLRWAERCRAVWDAPPGHALFGIVQGGVDPALRAESAAGLVAMGFDGYAVGGLAVGEGHETMLRVLEATVPALPADRPHYLMGVGKPVDLVHAVARGIDMFDCVMPTRSGRNAQAFTRTGTLNLRNARHADDPGPLDPYCRCPACRQFSRAYLHHLFRCDEILGPMLLTWHNLTLYQDLMAGLRAAIRGRRLPAFIAAFDAAIGGGEVTGTPLW